MATTVHQTTNYGMFKFSNRNRPINQAHKETLTQSIQEKCLIEDFPIVVDVHMNILDGQHRLAVCQELGLPVSYIISPNATVDDIAKINNTQRNWRMGDYLRYYGHLQDYQDFQNFFLHHKFNLLDVEHYTAAANILSQSCNEATIQNLKAGTFKYPRNMEKSITFINRLNQLAPSIAGQDWRHRELIRALIRIEATERRDVRIKMTNPKAMGIFKWNRMLRKITGQHIFFRDYMDILTAVEKAYNHGLSPAYMIHL